MGKNVELYLWVSSGMAGDIYVQGVAITDWKDEVLWNFLLSHYICAYISS